MRLSEKKQYRGYFWLPDWSDPEHRIPGELVIDTNGAPQLTLEYPNWNEDMPRPMERFEHIKSNRIHGTIEASSALGNTYDKFVILFGCSRQSYSIGSPTSVGVSRDVYYSTHCIIRACYEYRYFGKKAKIDFNSTNSVEFDALYFTIDRLANFLNVDGIESDFDSDVFNSIEWHKKSIEIPFCDGFALKAENARDYTVNANPPDGTEATIRDRVIWVLEFCDPLPVEECIKKIEHIKEFFAFTFNRNVGVTYLAGSLEGVEVGQPGQEEEGHEDPIWHEIHYPIDRLEPTTFPLKREHTPVAYKDFEDEKGGQLFGEYLSSYLTKRASDEWFDNVFSSSLYNMQRGNLMHLFKELISTLEYVRHEQKVCGEKSVEKLKVLIEGSGFSCDGDLIKRVREFVQNSSDCFVQKRLKDHPDSDESVLAIYAVYVRNTFAHGEKKDVDFSITKKLHLWLWKITSYHLLSMVKEGDELNRRIVEKSHRR